MSGAGFLYDEQLSLIGQRTPVGFDDGGLLVRRIQRDTANGYVQLHHYSGKFYNASTEHFGVFGEGDELVGVLQYGFAMNPASASSVVADTPVDGYLELNRMVLDDRMPRNSESRAISASIKVIRVTLPRVQWIQSFADERCGRLGVVYQACSFLYCGEHIATFWNLDGVTYHNSLMTRNPNLTPAAAHLQLHRHRAVATQYRQFRYIKFLHRSARGRLLYPVLPYPKPAADDSMANRLASSQEGRVRPPAAALPPEIA